MPHLSVPSQSLDHFFDSLAELEQRPTSRSVRMAFFGTSEIGFDRVTSQMRRILQSRFGDGGKGFVVIAPGWRYQRHRDVVWRFADTWEVFSVRAGRRDDGHYGFGGVLAQSHGPAWVEYASVPAGADHQGYSPFPAGSRFSRVELYAQHYPGGGVVRLAVDGVDVEAIATDAESVGDVVHVIELEDGPHTVHLSAGTQPVRLYGVVLERSAGLVLDAVMVIGAWAHTYHNYDPEHLARQVELRQPDLLIFQLGAKEVFRKPDLNADDAHDFVNAYAETVRRTRAGRPEASCLIVSMKDMGTHLRNRVVSKPAVARIVAGAEQVAVNTGCAFFNLFAALGGEGTMEAWSRSTPRLVSPDLGHLMPKGAIRVGDTLATMLLAAYDDRMRIPEREQP